MARVEVQCYEEFIGRPHSEGILEIYTKTWKPEEVKATLLFCHGIGEHINRYNDLFSTFALNGIKVVSFDQRGFGKTCERNGRSTIGISNFADTFTDMQFLCQKHRIEGKPLFIMGHSMGGGLALVFASLYPEGITGVIASAPMIKSGSFTSPNAVEKLMLKHLPSRLPNLTIPTKIDINNISRDPEQMKLYKEDQLIHGWASLGLIGDVFNQCGELLTKHNQTFTHPLLVTHGSLDTLTCPIASREFVDSVPSKDKQHVVYQGYVHELHNEPMEDRKIVYDQYVSWLLQRI